MSRYCFDLESDGLIPKVSVVHCIVLKDLDDGKITKFGGSKESIVAAVRLLENADEIIGHNIIAYDNQVLDQLYGFKPKGKITDTLVMARLIYADIYTNDILREIKDMPRNLYGSHSLKAWGMRLGEYKGDYTGGWEHYSQEMLDYCAQDVVVSSKLHKTLISEDFSQTSIDLEHSLAAICYRIGQNGWNFDVEAAGKLYAKLSKEREELRVTLLTLFPPWTIEEPFVPKVNNKKLGYVKGEEFIKKHVVEFNPNSRKHIAYCLMKKYSWRPKSFTPNGEPKIDETILLSLAFPEAKTLARMFLLNKRISQLAEGNGSWLKLVDADGRLRHTIISGGTVSGRAAHRSPALSTVPAVSAPFGEECRSLFKPYRGHTLVGIDLSGIEVRILASMLNDNGEYARHILEGDIHEFNRVAAKLDTRAQSKTLLYAMLFGAGDALLGKIVKGGRAEGKKIRQNFETAVPAFAQLKKDLKVAFERGYLIGLDKRRLHVRSEGRLLSQLLQSGGALVAKKWLQLVDQYIEDNDLRSKVFIVGWIHDELQISISKELDIDETANKFKRLSKRAGEAFSLKIPIDSEWKQGSSWAATH